MKWQKDKNGNIKKEAYDSSDAYTVALSYLKMNNYITS